MRIRDRVRELRRVPATELRAHPRNWRTHSDAQRRALGQMMVEVGFAGAVLAYEEDGELVVIDGHLRAQEVEGDVPVLVLDVTPQEALKLLLTIDPLGEMARTDEEALSALLDDVSVSSDELVGLLEGKVRRAPTPDELPSEVPTRTGVGETWRCGDHLVVCADVREVEIPSCDLVFTDPPYGVEVAEMAGDTPEEVAELLPVVLEAVAGALRPGGAFYVCSPTGEQEGVFRGALEGAGLRVRQQLVWVKDSLVLGRADYQWRHEALLYGWASGEPSPLYTSEHEAIAYGWTEGGRRTWRGGRRPSTVWEIPRVRGEGAHPTIKPVALVGRAIRYSSREGELVVDPFAGSGSTLVAAERLRRRSWTCEVEPRWCDLALARWEALTGREPERIHRGG